MSHKKYKLFLAKKMGHQNGKIPHRDIKTLIIKEFEIFQCELWALISIQFEPSGNEWHLELR